MPQTIARNLSDLLRLSATDDQRAKAIVDVAIAAASEGGYDDCIRGILWVTFAHLAEALHATTDETKRFLVKTALHAVEAELASRGASIPGVENRQAV